MKYNFDEIIPRRGTNSVKWDLATDERVLPMWVADMDFRAAPPVLDALERRLRHGVFGYTKVPDAYFEAVKGWFGKRHGFRIENEWILPTTGVIPALSVILKALTEPGDKVILQTPVYNCFFAVLERTGRQPLANPLINENGAYRMDFEDLERKAADPQAKLIFLCNPHNPGGRVWSLEELRRVAEICTANGTLVVSDEIHADLTLPGHRHTVFATVSEQARMNSVTYMAPSKTFNVPGLGSSYVICQNPDLFAKYQDFVSGRELAEGHVFAYDGLISAYSGPEGEEWLAQALDYIQENIRFIDAELRRRVPKIKTIMPDASYLVFLDCREMNLSQKELVEFFVDGARLALNDGSIFGKEGEGFMRLNAGCPRSILERALSQLEEAYENRGFRQQQSQN